MTSEVSLLPQMIVGLTAIGIATVMYALYHIHFVRGIKVRVIGDSYLCPRCERRLVDLVSNYPECNKKLLFPEKRQ